MKTNRIYLRRWLTAVQVLVALASISLAADDWPQWLGPQRERVLCLDEADGRIVWKHEYDCPYAVSYPAGPRATPAVGDGKVYTLGAEGNLLCLGAEKGNLIWSHDFKKDYGIKAPVWGFAGH